MRYAYLRLISLIIECTFLQTLMAELLYTGQLIRVILTLWHYWSHEERRSTLRYDVNRNKMDWIVGHVLLLGYCLTKFWCLFLIHIPVYILSYCVLHSDSLLYPIGKVSLLTLIPWNFHVILFYGRRVWVWFFHTVA